MFSANRYGYFFRFTCKVMTFVFFFAVGLLFAYMFSVSLGGVDIAAFIGAIVQQSILPISAFLLAWLFVAVSVEALR